MKGIIISLIVIFGVVSLQAQTRKVKENDLKGIWQMKIMLKEGLIEDELDEEDNAFAKMIIAATGSLVEGVLEEIDVKFEFLPDGVCKVYSSAFDSDQDVDYTKWSINSRGELRIDDSDSYNTNDDDYWLFEDDVLLLYNNNGMPDEDAKVLLYRID